MLRLLRANLDSKCEVHMEKEGARQETATKPIPKACVKILHRIGSGLRPDHFSLPKFVRSRTTLVAKIGRVSQYTDLHPPG